MCQAYHVMYMCTLTHTYKHSCTHTCTHIHFFPNIGCYLVCCSVLNHLPINNTVNEYSRTLLKRLQGTQIGKIWSYYQKFLLSVSMNIIIDNCTFTDNTITTDFEMTKPNHAAPEIITVAFFCFCFKNRSLNTYV